MGSRPPSTTAAVAVLLVSQLMKEKKHRATISELVSGVQLTKKTFSRALNKVKGNIANYLKVIQAKDTKVYRDHMEVL